tara:strand:+ start:276 stop:422 length:147 start_codon:yes stop_codon:yes gene_type:complete
MMKPLEIQVTQQFDNHIPAWMEVEAGTCRVIRQSGSFPIDLIEVEPKD